MAIIVSTAGRVVVNNVDLSDHCKSFTLNDGQETREVTAHGNTQRLYRAGVGTPSLECNFYLDHASGSVEPTLRALVTTTSTGVVVEARKVNTGSTTVNPTYTGSWVLDGDLSVLAEEHGEVGTITARFLPYSAISVSTTAT